MNEYLEFPCEDFHSYECYRNNSVRCLEITLCLWEKSTKLNNKKLLIYSILPFRNFKLFFVFSLSDTLKFSVSSWFLPGASKVYCQAPQFIIVVSLLSSHLLNSQLLLRHNKYVLIFLLAFDLASFFLPCLKSSVAET